MRLDLLLRRIIYSFFIVFLLCTFFVSPTHARTTSSILIDARSGNVILAHNANERRYPASLTKLMTLYITFNALEKGQLKLDDKMKVSYYASNRSPSRLGLRRGETITVENAIKALIVKSANDCAAVLAEALSGSETEFAKLMTKTAHELGMKNTTFMNASGLPNRKQKTTARDMAILGSAVYHHFPEYYDWFALKKFSYKGTTYYTHNHLLNHFEGADGMKTGYTNAAGFNIVTSAKRNGKRVIAVTMGHNSVKERDLKIARMMNTGLNKLNNSKPVKMAGHLNIPSIPGNNSKNISKDWTIQIGAFSNYIKARKYALDIQSRLRPIKAEQTNIKVEPASMGSAIIYRAQLSGFAKNEADKTCYRLKKANKSCIVISTDKQQMVVANK